MSSPGRSCFSSSQQRMPRPCSVSCRRRSLSMPDHKRWERRDGRTRLYLSPALRDGIRKPSDSSLGKRVYMIPSASGTAQSTEDESRVVINLRFPQHRYEFLLKAALLVMTRLLRDVFHHCSLVRGADAESGISLLPGKGRSVLVQPSRTVALQLLDGLGQRHGSGQGDEQMNMIAGPTTNVAPFLEQVRKSPFADTAINP